jgi:catechol 2,3-dioxygenase-like lactoylglutathione lyase family enzyme
VNLSIQTILLNVSNLERSVDFYVDVFDLSVTARREGVAGLVVSQASRTQTLVLCEVPSPHHSHGGRGSIGPRLLAFEAGSPDEIERVALKLSNRHALGGRTRSDTWEAIIGFDPDRIEVSLAASLTGLPIQGEDWRQIDDMVYQIG